MSLSVKIGAAVTEGATTVFGPQDPTLAMFNRENTSPITARIQVGIVEQFNVGLYSAVVSSGIHKYVCLIGAQNVTPGFGYSDINLLREGDEVIFATTRSSNGLGMILARKPTSYSTDKKFNKTVESDTDQERRTHFFSNDCYMRKSSSYTTPITNPNDLSTKAYHSGRPTDMVPGEMGTLNQHRCGIIGGMYSTTLVGGGAHIRIFSLENKIRIIADSIVKSTFSGNENDWHNRRYISWERAVCLYQEERLGLKSKDQPAFEEADYHEDGYFTKNKAERQTAKPRIVEQEGYYGNLVARYCLRPDPDSEDPRTMDDDPIDPGVARESIDASGQYRFAATGMIGFERVGRIPVPVRKKFPWQKEVEEPEASALTEFKHDEEHPYYRQLELADRVAYDLKNSYARYDEEKENFKTPEESELEGKLKDIYDPGFTESQTVKLEKYDKRRSGIWQGEDGSIIIRDAWGSEIVMIGGNIQLSCAGNVQTMPGKTAMTVAGDDIVIKAQNSVDIESADKDVRMNAFKNVQIMAGADDSNPGGITLEAKGKAYPWDGKQGEGGESIATNGIILKSDKGNIVTDTENLVLRGTKMLSIISGKESLDGTIMVSGDNVLTYGKSSIISTTDKSALVLSGSACLVGDSAVLAGTGSAAVFSGSKFHVPLTLADASDVASQVMSGMSDLKEVLADEEKVSLGYKMESLEKMIFRFRSSQECGTDKSWELSGSGDFTLYEPFWVQISPKFETLEGVSTKEFEDHKDVWSSDVGNPWPGTDAVSSGKYAQLSSLNPENLDGDGFNKSREEVVDHSEVEEKALFPGYLIRDN